ncbi:MAG: Rieske 2Fe-2S domain-containing protein [Candidatus Rokubacteria bacterium]|nr:Rieske 2Fe-2S domain-containing protein [Candidatus Rokubacteria bacterium]
MNDTIGAMPPSGEWRCAVAAVPPGHTATFRLDCGGRTVSGFVVNHDARYRAYVNRCPHRGTPLDLWPNELLAEDGRALVCSTHGALFEPDTGFCTAGPCAGDRLTPLPLVVDGDTLAVSCPQRPPPSAR